jgi:hypothetical protein
MYRLRLIHSYIPVAVCYVCCAIRSLPGFIPIRALFMTNLLETEKEKDSSFNYFYILVFLKQRLAPTDEILIFFFFLMYEYILSMLNWLPAESKQGDKNGVVLYFIPRFFNKSDIIIDHQKPKQPPFRGVGNEGRKEGLEATLGASYTKQPSHASSKHLNI